MMSTLALTPSRYRKIGCRKWPGALLVTAWWVVTVELLPNAIGLFGGYSLTYGSLAGVMVALLFFFVMGLGVVLISHNLHDVFEVATRITVLRLGRDVGVYEREKTTQQEIVQAITAGIPTKVAGISCAADGAPAGRYIATVEWLVRPKGKEDEQIVVPNKLPPRYGNPKSSRLEVEVVAGANDLPPFQLTR